MDLLKLDWDDAAEIRSARILTYRFEDIGVFAGTAVMKDGIVKIRIGEEVREFPRDKLIVIIEGQSRERDFWSAKISLGLVGRHGNTNQSDLHTTVRLQRQAPRTRFKTEYLGNIGKVEETQNLDYNSRVGVPETKNTYHHANGTLSIDILGDVLDLDIAAIWDRTENPQPDAEGNVPKRDDLRISFGLGVEF